MIQKERDIWVDNIKVLSCILVTLGHFFQSMVKVKLLPDNNFYQCFNQTIYYFHVQLFFICSGYLYQKYSVVDSVQSWKKNLRKKAIVLGVPYLAFSTATWLLKTIFSSSISNPIGGFFETLLLAPTAPYWFLYSLFFIFLVTPTYRNNKMMAVICCVAVFLRTLNELGYSTALYPINTILSNEIWFVLGMVISSTSVDRKIPKRIGVILGSLLFVVFLLLSIGVYYGKISFYGEYFSLSFLACAAVIIFFVAVFKEGKQNHLLGFLAEYTMPIFLMHTLFAAPLRIVLFGLGVDYVGVHIAFGLLISFMGPIIAAKIMKRFRWMDFFLYPSKYIRIKN